MEKDRLFTWQTLLLVLAGLAINFGGSQLALATGWPVFFDSIGTIMAGALGGYLPGVIVGFFSNAINSVSDPITLYYGIVNVLFGCAAAWLSERGAFHRVGTSALCVLLFAFIGGILGSLLTWMLYGLELATGVSAMFAVPLYEKAGFPPLLAQLTADFGVDLLDKLATVAVVFGVLKLLPDKLLGKLPLGYLYSKTEEPDEK